MIFFGIKRGGRGRSGMNFVFRFVVILVIFLLFFLNNLIVCVKVREFVKRLNELVIFIFL